MSPLDYNNTKTDNIKPYDKILFERTVNFNLYDNVAWNDFILVSLSFLLIAVILPILCWDR